MHGHQHKRMGVAVGVSAVIYTVLADADPALALYTVTAPIGAMLPDIDHDRSKLGSARKKVTSYIKIGVVAGIGALIVMSYIAKGIWGAILNGIFLIIAAILVNIVENNKYIKRQMGFITKHRGIMHTLIPPMFLFGTTLFADAELYNYSIYGLCIGYVVHLIGDMATTEGAPVLWPLTKNNIRYLPLNTSKHSTLLEVVCNVWCVVFVGISIYFGVKGGF